MSNALEAASLIMVPSGYEDGTLASVKPNDGTGDFTFSRGSNLSATRINEQGYIEKGYENLLLQSNTFSDADWIKSNTSVTGGQAGYDGTNDAWKIEVNTSNTSARLQQGISQNICTYSVYAKEGNTPSLGLKSDISVATWFDLSGSGSVTLGSGCVDASITSVGDGWFRCSVTFPVVTSVRFYVSDSVGSFPVSGGAYLYIQDAMLNQGLVAYPYIETTTASVAGGILEDMPRLDWSGSCPSLLLEPSRTNLITDSEYITIVNNASVSYNATESPEGLLNAPVFTATSGDLFVRSSTFAISTGTSYSISFYIKAFGTAVGKVSTTSVNDTASDSFTLTDSWQRITYTGTATNTRTNAQLRIDAPNVGGVAGEQVAIYGLQVEQDATYPTSYIPTYGVSQTRLGDLGDWRNNQIDTPILFGLNDDFTFFYEGQSIGDAIDRTRFMLVGGGYTGSGNDHKNRFWIAQENLLTLDGDGGIVMGSAILSSNLQEETNLKVLARKNGSTIDFFLNGVKQTTTQGTNSAFAVRTLFGSFNNFYVSYGRHKQLLVFPTALSDEECIQLTTV